MKRSMLIAALATALPGCHAKSQTAPFPPLGQKTYELLFPTDVPAADFTGHYPKLATFGNFGAEPRMIAANRARSTWTQSLRFSSRSWPGPLNVNVDGDYCPGAQTPEVKDGALRITAYPLSPADVQTCGQGKKTFASSFISSQYSFSQTYGYFEIEAKLPCDPGRWPAFWLLPTAKTPENMGQLPEIDVFEHYGGPMIKDGHVVMDRVGRPFSSIHYGVKGNQHVVTNAHDLPNKSPEQIKAFCAARHSFGVLWTPSDFRFYVDRVETFHTPNDNVTDPHYWVLNMDVSNHAGFVPTATDPSPYEIYAIRAWALPPGQTN